MEKCSLCVQRIQLGKNTRSRSGARSPTVRQNRLPAVLPDRRDHFRRSQELGTAAFHACWLTNAPTRCSTILGTRPNVGYLKKVRPGEDGLMSTATIDAAATAAELRLGEPQILPRHNGSTATRPWAEITADIAHPLEARPGKGWWICLAIALLALLNLLAAVGYLFAKRDRRMGAQQQRGLGL